MRALVIYESMFGNTRAVAEAIAAGLSERMPADAVEVGRAPVTVDGDVTLVVLGGPTHAFGMSRATSRADAVRRTGTTVESASIGQREWLEQAHLPDCTPFATFDTRMGGGRIPGSAAHAAHRRLRRLGATPLADPASFYVSATTGPLDDGELHRARDWGRRLADLSSEHRQPVR